MSNDWNMFLVGISESDLEGLVNLGFFFFPFSGGGLPCGLLKQFCCRLKHLEKDFEWIAVFQKVVYHQCYSFSEKVYMWWSGLSFGSMSLQMEAEHRVLPVP